MFRLPRTPLSPALDEAIAGFLRKHNKPRRVYSSVPPIEQRLARLGAHIGIRGDTLAYPFGGMDVSTPFLMADLTDVVSQGAQPFGTDEQLTRAIRMEQQREVTLLDSTAAYDQTRQLSAESAHYGCIGQRALARIHRELGGPITSISRFLFDHDGTPVPSNDGPHAAITFEHNGRERRFWYVEQRLPTKENPYTSNLQLALSFFARIPAQTTLIKAAHPFWLHTEPHATHALAIAPARARNDLVIADGNTSNLSNYNAFEPRPIWAEPPAAVDIYRFWGTGLTFGYDSVVQYASGAALIGKDTLPERT